MTLSVNEPSDQRLVSELPSYIRANRVAINDIDNAAINGDVGYTDLVVAAASTFLTTGIEINSYGLEVIKLSGAGVSTLTNIFKGTEGQIKIFIAQDTNVRFTDGMSKLNGTFYLNQLPAGGNFNPQVDDIISMVNIGGNGSSIGGYWKELYRTLSVK